MRRATVISLAAVAALLVVPAYGKGCAAVRTSGPWTATDLPVPTPFAQSTTYHGGALKLGGDGPATAALATYGGDVLRSTDGQCTWHRVYTLDPNEPSSAWGYSGDYTVRSMSASADGRMVYVLLSADEWAKPGGWFAATGGFSLFPLAVSADGGKTWRTDLIATDLPVLGTSMSATVTVAPSDPRVVYAHLGARRTDDPNAPYGVLYRSNDAGLTWTYVTGQSGEGAVAVDPANPNVVYITEGTHVDVVTVGATVARRRLLAAANQSGTVVEGLDAARPRGSSKTQLVVTESYPYTGSLAVTRYYAYRSADAGQHWSRSDVPLGAFNSYQYVFPGGGLRFAANGDIVGLANTIELQVYASWLVRWDAKRRAWQKRTKVTLPPMAGYAAVVPSWFVPSDAARTVFVWGGSESSHNGPSRLVSGTFDPRR